MLLAVTVGTATLTFGQADNCIQNEFNVSQGASRTSTAAKNRLNCTANDVRIAKVLNVRDAATGAALPSCSTGVPFDFIADFQIVTTASSTRSNIGLYIAETGTTTADALSVNNTCADNVIPPPANLSSLTIPVTGNTNAQFFCNGSSGQLCGTNYFDEYDPHPDSCGDSSSNDNGGAAATQIVTLLIKGFSCPSPVGLPTCTVGGKTGPCAVLPNCTSWQIPGGVIQCTAPSGQQSYDVDQPTAVPADKSKCNCETIPLPIIIQSPTISVAKTCTTANETDAANCTLTPEGGTVTYNITITNTSNFGSVTIDQICDSAFGNLGTVSGFTPSCATGNTAAGGTQAGRSALVSGQNGCIVPQTLTAAGTTGATYTCSFQANQIENVTVDDTVSTNGLGQDGTTPVTGSSTQVEVVSHEANTTGLITKGVDSTRSACVTVRYKAQVKNTSAAGTDETLNLSSVSDNTFGSITTLHGTGGTGTVVGTTCGVAAGLGTLAGTGAGTLPVTLNPGGTYPASTFNSGFCNFDGVLCGTTGTTGCTIGFSDTDNLSATLTDDEGAAVTLTPGQATVNACINVN
jgi:hypothetical protein